MSHISPIKESLGLKAREVISLVGAGGKTTLMFHLAKELFLDGRKIVTTTTTKILEPESGETPFLYINTEDEKLKQFISNHLEEYKHVTIASEKLDSGKLKGISPALAHDIWSFNKIDYLIIEADGAAGRPVKAPGEREPVISLNTTLVIALLGVDGLETELNEENVFRAELVSKMTGIPMEGRITDEAMAVLMTHPEGIFKGAPPSSRVVAFLNKIDIPDGVGRAKRIAKKIFEKKHPQVERVVLGQLMKEPPVIEVILP